MCGAAHAQGVAYSHRSTYLHTLAAALPDNFNLSSRDCVLPVVPMFHALAWGLPFIVLMLGCRVCLLSKFTQPLSVLHCFRDHPVTFAGAVPTVWHR